MEHPNTGVPSEFWVDLARTHETELKTFGIEQMKRHQALRYFTWQWRLDRLVRSEQLRFLLTHTSPRQWLSCLSQRMSLSDADWTGVNWSRGDRRVYSFVIRLLWEFAHQHDVAGVCAMEEPLAGAPLPVYWNGRLISQDLANCALESAAISRALVGHDRPKSILEIGAGYGRTAYVLLKLYPEATYTICDIEPALSISKWYLSQLFSSDRLKFVPAAQVDSLEAGSFDLALSISSLQEMTNEQIARYLAIIDRVTDGGIVYLKQWIEWRNPVDKVTTRCSPDPIPRGWRQLFRERAPVQTNFQQAAWDLRRA